jgi:predicted enzyme related to lactoylglutathione lyase
MGNPIVFFEVTCRDAAPLAAFYSSVFGWTVTPHSSGEYQTVTTGEGIDGMITQLPDDMRATLTVFVATDDLDTMLASVAKNGGVLLFPPMDLPNGERIAMINDPAGTTIGLIQQR